MVSSGFDRGPFVGMTLRERTGMILLLTALVLVFAAFNLPQLKPSLVQVWLAFIAYAVVLALPFIWYRPSWGWLHPLVFWVVWFGVVLNILPKVGVYANGLGWHAAMPGAGPAELNGVVTETLLLTTIGWLALYLGFVGSGRPAAPRLIFKHPRFLLSKVVIIAGVAIFALLLLIHKAGGVGPLLLQRGLPTTATIFTHADARFERVLVTLLRPACLVWLALRPNAWRKPLWLAFFGLSLIISFMATGSRSGIAIPCLQAGVIWMLHYRRVPYTAIIIAAVLSMAILGIGGSFRHASRGAETLSDVNVNTNFASGVLKGFEQFVNRGAGRDGTYGILANVPSSTEFLYGKSYLSVLVAPIPSLFLPVEKPHAAGKLNASRIFNIPSGGIPPGNVGEAYWNFGVAGVAIIMALFGMMLKWFYRLYFVNEGRGWAIAVYVVTLFSLQPNSPAVYHWLHAIIPIFIFLLLFCGLPNRPRKSHLIT